MPDPATAAIARKLTGIIRLLTAREGEAAIQKMLLLVNRPDCDLQSLTVIDGDVEDYDRMEEALHQEKIKREKWQTAATNYQLENNELKKKLAAKPSAEPTHLLNEIDSLKKQLAETKTQIYIKDQIITQITQERDEARNELSKAKEIIAELPQPKPMRVTTTRYECLNEIQQGLETTATKRVLEDCIKAGWLDKDNNLTEAGEQVLMSEAPKPPKPRVSAKQLQKEVELAKTTVSRVYNHLDEILNIVESDPVSQACRTAAQTIRSMERHSIWMH